jgi:hypothetical protein
MAKLLFWIILIFAVLVALRLWNVAKARRAAREAGPPAAQPMVRCVQCGVFLPRPDARATADGFRCTAPDCNKL